MTDNAISMDFSPDGTILATAGGARYEVRLWDVESGNLLYSLPHNDQLTSIAFSPDGGLLAVGCFDSNIYLYEIQTNPSASLDALPDWIAAGEGEANNFGYSVATAGDVNGDGYADVVVGADRYKQLM